MCTNLLVIGASARALAASAGRLGLEVNAIDLFGDRDLRDVCSRVVQVAAPAYPDELPRIAAEFPAGPGDVHRRFGKPCRSNRGIVSCEASS